MEAPAPGEVDTTGMIALSPSLTVVYKMSVGCSCNIGGVHFGAIIKFLDKLYTPASEWGLPFRKLNLELFYSYLSERNIIAAVI